MRYKGGVKIVFVYLVCMIEVGTIYGMENMEGLLVRGVRKFEFGVGYIYLKRFGDI